MTLVCCNAQESTEFMKVDENVNNYGKFASASIQQENSIGMCWNQLDKMGNVLESYRKLLMTTMMESTNICGIIKALTEDGTIDDNNNNIQEGLYHQLSELEINSIDISLQYRSKSREIYQRNRN